MKVHRWKDTEIAFDEKEHAYTCEGRFIPGVTSILKVIGKEALIGWAANCAVNHIENELTRGMVEALVEGKPVKTIKWDWEKVLKDARTAHRRISKEAADIGSNVHKYAEAWLKRLPAPELTTDQAKRGAEAFEKWMAEHHVECVASEQIIFSKEHWFAGQTDFIGRIDGESAIADFKSSSGIYPDFHLQVAAYKAAREEETGKPIQNRYIIRFDKKTGAFEARKIATDHERDFNAFLAAMTLSKTLKQIEEETR